MTGFSKGNKKSKQAHLFQHPRPCLTVSGRAVSHYSCIIGHKLKLPTASGCFRYLFLGFKEKHPPKQGKRSTRGLGQGCKTSVLHPQLQIFHALRRCLGIFCVPGALADLATGSCHPPASPLQFETWELWESKKGTSNSAVSYSLWFKLSFFAALPPSSFRPHRPQRLR